MEKVAAYREAGLSLNAIKELLDGLAGESARILESLGITAKEIRQIRRRAKSPSER